MTIHYLAGMPRSGSTLLANLLAQHPDIAVTGTSPLFGAVTSIVDSISNVPEVVAELENVPGTYDRYLGSVKAFMDAWHSNHRESIVIDKHRGWPARFALLEQLDPDSRIIMCVRDPRSVVASFDRQERKTALFNSPVSPTLYDYADKVMSPEGMVGRPIKLIEDMLARQVPVVWVRYETFTREPGAILGSIAAALDLEEFAFDLEDIRNQSTDLDALYRGKYPHDGSGPLTPARDAAWQDVMTPEIANLIAGVSPLLMQTFAYS